MPGDDSPAPPPPVDIERSAAALKRLLRGAALERRCGRTLPDRAAAGRALARHCLELARSLGARTVAAYVGVGDEPPTLTALDALRSAGVRVLLPSLDGRALRWSTYAGEASLVTTGLGLREPPPDADPGGALTEADLVLAPAVLVDRAGHRLGRGGGYYDRALADVATPVYAVVYDGEVVDALPAEPHDVRMSGAVTPSGVVPFRFMLP